MIQNYEWLIEGLNKPDEPSMTEIKRIYEFISKYEMCTKCKDVCKKNGLNAHQNQHCKVNANYLDSIIYV